MRKNEYRVTDKARVPVPVAELDFNADRILWAAQQLNKYGYLSDMKRMLIHREVTARVGRETMEKKTEAKS